jgi:acylphosphatase
MIKKIECIISAEKVDHSCLVAVYDLATKLNLKGVVLTRDDGSVRVVAEGEEDNLEEFIKRVQKNHLVFPVIYNFYVKWEKNSSHEFDDFSILNDRD